MARVIGRPGLGAARATLADATTPMTFGLVLTVAAVALTQILHGLTGLLWLLALALGAILYRRELARSYRDIERVRRRWRTVGGGRCTADALAELPDDYIVFNDFPAVGDTSPERPTLDHVVVGPTGVFVLDSSACGRPRPSGSPTAARISRAVPCLAACTDGLNSHLASWSGGTLAGSLVEAVIVCDGDDARVVHATGGSAHVVGERRLLKEIQRRRRDVGPEARFDIARELFAQLPEKVRTAFGDEMAKVSLDVKAERGRDGAVARVGARTSAPFRAGTSPERASCPECGAPLVRRTMTRGPARGRTLVGCSTWPTCGYVANPDA